MRDMPPTSSTSWMSAGLTPASFMQLWQGCTVRSSSPLTSCSNLVLQGGRGRESRRQGRGGASGDVWAERQADREGVQLASTQGSRPYPQAHAALGSPGERHLQVLGAGGIRGDEGQVDVCLGGAGQLALSLLRRLAQPLHRQLVLGQVDALWRPVVEGGKCCNI